MLLTSIMARIALRMVGLLVGCFQILAKSAEGPKSVQRMTSEPCQCLSIDASSPGLGHPMPQQHHNRLSFLFRKLMWFAR